MNVALQLVASNVANAMTLIVYAQGSAAVTTASIVGVITSPSFSVTLSTNAVVPIYVVSDGFAPSAVSLSLLDFELDDVNVDIALCAACIDVGLTNSAMAGDSPSNVLQAVNVFLASLPQVPVSQILAEYVLVCLLMMLVDCAHDGHVVHDRNRHRIRRTCSWYSLCLWGRR